MTFCVNCGREMDADWNACPSCGTMKAGSDAEKEIDPETNVEAGKGLFNLRKEINSNDPKKRRNTQNNAPITPWNQLVGKPSRFVKDPPLKFQYDAFDGYILTVRLMFNSELMLAFSVEVQNPERTGLCEYNTLYYWKVETRFSRSMNTIYLIDERARWADNSVYLRHGDAIETYNYIDEMLDTMGIDTRETFD